jgi:hypothetical protein
VDYFQGVVTEYLRADRAIFVNTECLIQLEPGDVPAKSRHWYCDATAINLRESKAYLCEITYSATLHALLGRLAAWAKIWPQLRAAILRDCSIPLSWQVQPWVFIPQARHEVLKKKFALIKSETPDTQMPDLRITYLESVTPWNYRSWDRQSDAVATDA